MERIVFLVSLPGMYLENVIVNARDREHAKNLSRHILGGDPDEYTVTPITQPGSQTVFLLRG